MKSFTKLLIALVGLALATPSFAAITYFDRAQTPADNSAQFNTAAVAVTPPASMTAGQLVVIEATWHGCTSTSTLTLGTTGGQTWTSEPNHAFDTPDFLCARTFWTRFNGTWGANPTVVPSSNGTFTSMTVVMTVFTPTSSSNTWATDVAEAGLLFAAPGGTQDVAITGQTAIASSTVTLAMWHAQNIATWSTLTGGWTYPGSLAQVRNTANNDASMSLAYKIQTSAGATGSPSNRESSNNSGYKVIQTWKEVASATPTFSVSPAIGTRTISSIPITATTACADCTFYGVAYTDGSGTPSCTQIKAAQDSTGAAAYKSFNLAATASVQATGTFSTYTSGTVRDSAYCLNSTSGGDSTVATLADIYKKAAFSVTPFVSARTATTHTVSSTLDGAGNIYAVGCALGATAPTVSQIKAGQCTGAVTALASANKAVTGADTLTLTYASPLLVYAVYQTGLYGSQDSDITTLATEIAGGATGYTAPAAFGTICTTGPCPVLIFNTATNPDIVAGDYYSCTTVTTPDSFAVTYLGDGNLSYSGTTARQNVTCKFYDVSTFGMFAASPAVFYINNTAPSCTGPFAPIRLKQGVAMTPVTLGSVCTDADGDTLTAAVTSGTINPGLSMASTSVVSGTPTAPESEAGNAIGVTFTDIASDTANLPASIAVANTLTVPTCPTSMLAADCTALIQANGWLTALPTYVFTPAVPAGFVVGLSPTAGTEVQPFTSVTMQVSLGTYSTTVVTDGYGFIIDPANGTHIYVVSLLRHSTTPTCSQIVSHAGALAFGDATSLAGEPVSISLTPIPYARTHVHIVGVGVDTVCTAITSLPGLLKTPPNGSQYISVP